VRGESREVETVAGIRRRWGKLYAVTTSGGRRYLVLKDPSSERFLKEGVGLDREALELLGGTLARTAGMALAYRLLAVRDRTEREITTALSREGITTPEVVGEIIGTLRRQGYLDDRRLASHFVQYAAKHKPSGPRLLRRKLRDAGVGEEIINEEIRGAFSPEREREIAAELARRKIRGIEDREKAVRRVHGLLSRRGFSERVINSICSAILRGTLTGERE